MSMKQTIATPSTKPRNPLVAAAHFRQAGRHGGKSAAVQRRAGRRALARELSSLELPRETRGKPPSF